MLQKGWEMRKDEARYREAEQSLFADAGVEPAERWIDLKTLGVRARILEVGEGDPVLFLSGGPMAGATWAYVAAHLRDRRVVLLDRPGTGLSEPPRSVPGPAELPDYVAQLTVDVLDALDVPSAPLVGSSFGGYSALRSAMAHPRRVDQIVLAGCPAFVPGWSQPSFFTLLRTPIVGRLLLAVPATRSSALMSLKQLGHRASLETGRIPLRMVDWTLAWQRDTDTMRNDAAMIRRCGVARDRFDPALDLDERDLAAVRSHVHIVAGSDDPVGGEEVCRRLAAALPSASVEVVERAGHLPWLDDPARVAMAIRRCLSDRAGSSR